MAIQKFNIKGGFFDSISGDRRYSAADMNKPYNRLITDGVFATPQGTPSTDLQVVSARNGMGIIVKAGAGLLDGKWFESLVNINITVPANTNVVPRRDSVIIQMDERESGRVCNIIYKEGTPSEWPQPPDINNIDNVIEKRIANIYVAAGAGYIGDDAIVDLRGSSECPWITSLIQQVDTSTLYNQYRAAYDAYYERETELFNAFMSHLTEQLTVDTNIIKYESHYTTTVNGTTVIPINIEAYNRATDVLMVRVNKLFASEGTDYSIANDGTSITLTKDVYAGQNIDFLVLQSVVIDAEAATILGAVQQISNQVTSLNNIVSALNSDSGWINFTLEGGTAAFDSTVTPGVRKFGNMVNIRGAIKNVPAAGTTICTLPTNMRPSMNFQFAANAISNGVITGTAIIEATTSGPVKVIAKSGTIGATDMLSIATNFIIG